MKLCTNNLLSISVRGLERSIGGHLPLKENSSDKLFDRSSHTTQQLNANSIPDTVCSLHATSNASPFFVSDVISASLNPMFPVQINCEKVDSAVSPQERISVCHHYQMIVRIWQVDSLDKSVNLLLEWDVDLRGMQSMGSQLSYLDKDLDKETILFEFKDGYYTSPDILDAITMPPKLNEPITLYNTYDFRQVIKLVEMHRKVIELYKGTQLLTQQIADHIKRNEALMRMKRTIGERRNNINKLKEQLLACNMQIISERMRLDNFQERINIKRGIVKEHCKRLHDAVLATETLEQELNTTRELLYSMNEQVDKVQQERITSLADLYPISHANTINNAYTIRDIHLPSADHKGFHSEDVATALGYTCHLVEMISYYLRVPLIYPMIAMSSRAYIINPLAPDVDQAIYPLYGKGQDAARLKYGVFLLNMNIQQLMTSQHLNAKRPRDTLLNILTLLWKTSGEY
ncbi:UV radiation resistance protein and autophagy-related subunit 14-domain-containing protein [Syncephalis plumigaleata]|nr:UV radiation resistance protein and autophagy-related subunit 14-domain-containing protein [Syncephalis plumigaleata]